MGKVPLYLQIDDVDGADEARRQLRMFVEVCNQNHIVLNGKQKGNLQNICDAFNRELITLRSFNEDLQELLKSAAGEVVV